MERAYKLTKVENKRLKELLVFISIFFLMVVGLAVETYAKELKSSDVESYFNVTGRYDLNEKFKFVKDKTTDYKSLNHYIVEIQSKSTGKIYKLIINKKYLDEKVK